ncbi:hypothetical protein TRFO_12336 [Tritrichomonas foetus]|uniref:Uncharacterized protein n=1 Tax=Tritrichomonas foetus TaxID=1144522 RepID=A0A1J4IZD5_9EUKA|nr:hypothetical protein TRFO_12336 [Tritrichomonas foetus]|eukprot:OHS92774.1 hypothetical protein TRFO_12336 [Tritrichomonas foetus]
MSDNLFKMRHSKISMNGKMNELMKSIHQLTCSKGKESVEKAKKVLSILRHGDIKEFKNFSPNRQNNPKFYFAFTHPDIDISITHSAFNACLYNESLLQNDIKLAAKIYAQIASSDFPHFIEFLVPFLVKGNETHHYLLYEVAAIILNPLSGFLLYAPKTKKNKRGFHKKNSYDFFTEDSDDLKTRFGIALTKFRSIILDMIMHYKKTNEISLVYNPGPSIFTPSITSPSVNSTIKSYPNFNDLSCGFPYNLETLSMLSSFLDLENYTIGKTYQHSDEKIIQSWENYYKAVTNFDPIPPPDVIPFFTTKTPLRKNNLVFLKLIPFLGLSSIKSIFNDEMFFMAKILGEDSFEAAFYLIFCQVLLLIYEETAVPIFDAIVKVCQNLQDYSDNQYYTILHSVSQLVDVLCVHPTCRIREDHISIINSLALIGFCCLHIEIRNASFRLLKCLGRLSPNVSPIYNTIIANKNLFPKIVMPFFDNNPVNIIISSIAKPKNPLTLRLAINSDCPTLWQIFLIAFGKVIAEKLDKTIIMNYKKLAVVFLSPKSETPKNVLNINFPIHVLTVLVSLTKIDDDCNQAIFAIILEIIKNYNSSNLCSLLPMIQIIPSESFDLALNMITNEDHSLAQLLILRSIFWNPDFFARISDDLFIEKFTDVFLNVTMKLADEKILFFTLTSTLSQHEIKALSENTNLCSCYAAVCYRLFSFLREKHSTQQEECFPCKCRVKNSNHPEILKLSLLFSPLLKMALLKPSNSVKFSDRLRKYAIRSLSQFLACSKLSNTSFLFDNIFPQFESFISFCPLILHHLLEHNFAEVFPIVLSNSLKPNGLIYIQALCSFFRSSDSGVEFALDDVLTKQQWASLSPITRSSNRLQVIYENCGTFIFACLLYLVRSDSTVKNETYILLATLCPILLLFENDGRREYTHDFIKEIAQICSKCDKSFTTAEIETISNLGRILCTKFAFCTEQVLKAAFDNLPSFPDETINEVLSALLPWFASIDFDFEDRVVSKDTDLVFICFTCYSFIETLANSFTSGNDFNSPVFGVWRALVMDDEHPTDNFLPVLLCLFTIGEKNTDNSNFLINLIRFLSTLNPPLVMSIVTAQISFSDYFHSHKQCRNHIFVLSCLRCLCGDSARAAIPFLYLIFAFSIIFHDVYPKCINQLLKCIAISIESFVHDDSRASYEAIRRSIDCYDIKSDEFYQFLKIFDEFQATSYLMELYRWGLCCGDLKLAATALRAKPVIPDPTVMGLCARVLANISAAIMATNNKSYYYPYIITVLQCLQTISLELDAPSNAIFWIAAEFLRCPQSDVFKHSLQLFDSFVGNPRIFNAVNGSSDEMDSQIFTKKALWEFHSPWNEKYEGCAKYIYKHSGKLYKKCVKVLINLILIKFKPLVSDKENCLETALLAILPYLWMISANTIRRSIENIKKAKDVINALKSMCLENDYLDDLLKCFEFPREVNLRDTMLKVANKVIEGLDDDDLMNIAIFYTSNICYKTNKMIVPLVILISKIIETRPSFSKYLNKFVSHVVSSGIKNNSDINHFLNRIKKTMNGEDYINIDVDENIFPPMPLFDRIVVVIVPHLYDSNLADQVNAEFDDLNSFPPLLPFDESIMHLEKFRSLEEHISQIEIIPFVDWDLMLQKMKFTLTDSGFIPQKLVSKIHQIDIKAILLEEFSLAQNEIDKTSEKEPSEPNIMFEEEEEIDDEMNINVNLLPSDPYGLIVVGAWSFVPSVELSNSIGDELFEEMGSEEIDDL